MIADMLPNNGVPDMSGDFVGTQLTHRQTSLGTSLTGSSARGSIWSRSVIAFSHIG
jgi:hypothetical protein